MENNETGSSWVSTALFGVALGLAYVAGTYTGAEIGRAFFKAKEEKAKDNSEEV